MDCVIVFTENDQMIFFINIVKFFLLRQLVLHLQFMHSDLQAKNVFKSRGGGVDEVLLIFRIWDSPWCYLFCTKH